MAIIGSRRFLSSMLCLIFVFITLTEAQIHKDSHHRIRDNYRRERLSHLNSKAQESRINDDPIRLPTALVPTHESIRINPLIGGNFSTYGSVSIDFDCIEEIDFIELHMLDIITKNETIQVVDVADPDTPLEIVSHEYNVSKQVYAGRLRDPLIVGHSYRISMEFEGFLNDILKGFYRSFYQENDEDVYLATTQFEATQARRAFPCFDEPALKVTFDVELARDSGRHCISNMPMIDTYTDQDGLIWDIFETSEKMSSYLVAFLVSEFVQVSRTTNDSSVLFGVWARQEAIDDTAFALQNGPDILSFYEQYYNILFPLPKQDMAAIPDFEAGAMENWGLITYREKYILYNAKESSEYNKMYVAIVMAHELAHQWFGDLVTMKWWTDLWLNEGFAAYMQYLGTNAVRPEYEILNQYTIDETHQALAIDSLESSHPISIELTDPDDIWANFDTISYSKGCSIIRMMKTFLKEATFSQAITNYLNKHAYANAEQDDLWAEMTSQGWADGTLDPSMTIKEIMDTWTLQMGYPLISVVVNTDGTADLSKERFLSLHDPNSTDTHEYKWWVPITYTSEEDPEFGREGVDVWMAPDETLIRISGLSTSAAWHLFNVDQVSYYRVNYDDSNWQNLITQLNSDHEALSILTRTQLNDDAMDLARAIPGKLSYDIALEINNYLVNERDFVPWFSALSNLEYLEQMFTNTSTYPNLQDFILDLSLPFYNSTGFNDSLQDPHMDQMSRSLMVDWVCHLGYSECVNNADNLFANWMLTPDNNPISPNLRFSVYCTGIANGGQNEFDFAYDQYLNTNLANERETLLTTMGCSRDDVILETYLDLTYRTSDSDIRLQDEYMVWGGVAENDYGNNVAWDYLNTYWEDMAAYYGSYAPLAGKVSIVTAEWNTPEELQTLVDLRDAKEDQLGSSVETVNVAIKNVESNIAWMNDYQAQIRQWLIDNDH